MSLKNISFAANILEIPASFVYNTHFHGVWKDAPYNYASRRVLSSNCVLGDFLRYRDIVLPGNQCKGWRLPWFLSHMKEDFLGGQISEQSKVT